VGRPAHPHVHAILRPRFENRMAVHISPQRIQRVKEARSWPACTAMNAGWTGCAWISPPACRRTVSIERTGCLLKSCRSVGRLAGIASSSSSAAQGELSGSHRRSPRRGSGCGSAGGICAGNGLPRGPPAERRSGLRPRRCLAAFGRRSGPCAGCERLGFVSDRRAQWVVSAARPIILMPQR
jgi:hypothetical protein